MNREPVLKGVIIFTALSIFIITARLTLQGYVYIDLEKKEFQRSFKIFWFERTTLVIHIKDIMEIGVSTLKYSYSLGGSSFSHYSSDAYFIVALSRKETIIRVSGEYHDLAYSNEWMQQFAKKLRKPFLFGKKGKPLNAFFNSETTCYQLNYSAEKKSWFAQNNMYGTILLICSLIVFCINIWVI